MSGGIETVVEISQGKLRGKREESAWGPEFYCFHRIPYAEPPVGELRFRAPRPAGKWTGVLDATKEGPVCPSADWGKANFLEGSSEDSLFINVYCRQDPKGSGGKKRPVLVWFHGGGFEFGSGNRNLSGPEFFMSHDVILVTFNYRIGVLGFLSLQTPECPGNFGLKDQQLALMWVRNNIACFGGDPDNVTIFGISAGGASVHYQTLCLSNKGLFARAIIQSGSALNRWAYSRRPRENAFALARRLGCDARDDEALLDFLRKAPVEDIVMKGLGVINETEGEVPGERFLNFTFVPTAEPPHEGAFITQHPWGLLKEGKYLDVPLLTGITSDEMVFEAKWFGDCASPTTPEDFQRLIPRDIQLPRNGQKALDLARRIKEFYFKDGVNLKNYVAFLSDNFFNYGVFKFVKSRTTNTNFKSPTYLYKFTYEGDQVLIKGILGLKDVPGACHGDDTMYLFRTDFTDVEKMRPGSRDHDFMTRLTKLWTNYATTGVPALGNEPGLSWKETSFEHLEYLDLGEELLMKKGFIKDRMEFWDDVYSSYYG